MQETAPGVAAGTEDRLISWLRKELVSRGSRDFLGNDVARLPLSGDWAISVDQQIEGVHFPAGLGSERIGRRLVAVNLSDLAAAAAEPRFGFATLAAPADFDHKGFFRGLLDAGREHGLTLAGGDLARSDRIHAALTVCGKRGRRRRFLGRDLAREGDSLWLGGSVGESALGRSLLARGADAGGAALRLPATPAIPRSLRGAARAALARHLDPEPQLELGAWLGGRRRAAAIDISDGLLLDLRRLARASRIRCELDVSALPSSPGFSELARQLELDPTIVALTGGEDYVLLFCLPERLRPPNAFRATRVGRVSAAVDAEDDAAVILRGFELPPGLAAGWDHLAEADQAPWRPETEPRGSR